MNLPATEGTNTPVWIRMGSVDMNQRADFHESKDTHTKEVKAEGSQGILGIQVVEDRKATNCKDSRYTRDSGAFFLTLLRLCRTESKVDGSTHIQFDMSSTIRVEAACDWR